MTMMLGFLPQRFALAAIICAFAGQARSHDFWIQPEQFWVTPDTTVITSLQVGHGEARERWNADVSRVTAFYSLSPREKTDRLPELRAGSMDKDHPLRVGGAGAHWLVLQTNYATSELPGLRFNAYLNDEGLVSALKERARTKSSDRPGREIYSRRAKALLQVGSPNAKSDKFITAPVGLSLEIVPERNPYLAQKGTDLPVRVFYEGKPLEGGLVKLNNLDSDDRPVAQVRTDSAGRATFTLPRSGNWQFNIVWTKPISNNPDADFDTTFSSFTLGFPRVAPTYSSR